MINWRKIKLYILISCLFSWAVALIIYLTQIDISSISGTIMLAGLYMPGPAVATIIIQKYIYRQRLKEYGWTFDKKAIKWILLTPLLFLALTMTTFAIIALLGNSNLIPQFGKIDFSQTGFDFRLREVASSKIDVDTVEIPQIPPLVGFFAMLGQGIIGGSTLSLPFMLGEELGWRGLMQRETVKLGFLRSSWFIGLVWGIWHFPVILMGHNYPHYPIAGIFMMCLFTMSISPLFTYVRIKTKSILGACMLHGMINATGMMYMLYVANGNELYSSIAGWAGIIAGAILTLCIVLLDRNFVRDYRIAIATPVLPSIV